MTSSIQLATEIQQTEPPDPAEQDSMQNVAGQTIEGIELIAKSLDSSKSWIYSDMLVCWDEILELFFWDTPSSPIDLKFGTVMKYFK